MLLNLSNLSFPDPLESPNTPASPASILHKFTELLKYTAFYWFKNFKLILSKHYSPNNKQYWSRRRRFGLVFCGWKPSLLTQSHQSKKYQSKLSTLRSVCKESWLKPLIHFKSLRSFNRPFKVLSYLALNTAKLPF